MDMRELFWAAGFLEGEGSFGNQRTQVCVSAVQVQRQPLDRLQALFGGKIYQCGKRREGQSDYFKWNTQGSHGAGIAMTLFVLMSPRRQAQIEKAVAKWRSVRAWVQGSATHCPKFHPYDETNTYQPPGSKYKVCRKCRNAARDRAVAEKSN